MMHVDAIHLGFLALDGKGERPVGVVLHGLDEFVGDEQRQVELAQAAVLALGADEVDHVRMTHVEGAHLRAAAPAGRGHGEAHGVVDVHEGQRTRGVGTGARDIGPARSQGREFIADAAAGLERKPRFVDLVQDVVHRITDRAGDRAVDGGGGRFMFERAGVGGDAPGGNGAAPQRPQKSGIPFVAHGGQFDIGQRARHALVGVIDRHIQHLAGLGLEAIFLVPDVFRGRLQRQIGGGIEAQVHRHGAHERCSLRRIYTTSCS